MVVTIITIKNSSTIHFAAFMGIVYIANASGEKISRLNVAQCPTKAEFFFLFEISGGQISLIFDKGVIHSHLSD